jgi:hypothetical protein
MQDVLNQVSVWLPFLAFFLPLVIGLVTKSTLSEKGKTVVMLVLTGVAALLSQVDANAGLLTVEMLTTWVGTVVVTIASYYGVWKPIGAGNVAPKVGIGPSDDTYQG